MGKPKKGKANYEDEELENADSLSGKADSKESQKPGENTKGGKDKKKKKGKGKNEDDFDSEEDAKIEQHVSDLPTAKKEKKKQKGKTRHDDNMSEDEAVSGKPDQKQTESAPVSKKDKKKKKGKGKEDTDDSEADNDDTRQTHQKPADKTTKETTHINKKDKKQKGGKAKAAYDEDESDADSVPDKNGQGKAGDPPALSKKQKKKKGKNKDEDSEDEDETELAAMLGQVKINDEPAVPAFNKNKDKKLNKASVFELIGDMMDNAGDDSAEASDQDTPEEKVVVPVPAANKSKKEKKNKKSQKNQEEEDIDAIMASLEDPSVGKKKGKKKKKNEEEEDSTTVSELTEVQKVEPKVVTIDDLDDEEYDTKRKKKGKKAAAPAEETSKSEDRKEAEDGEEEGEEGGTVKSAAQKRKEKRDKEKQKKQLEKQKQKKPESKTAEVEVKPGEVGAEAQAAEDSSEAAKPGDSASKDGEAEEEAADGKKKKKKKGEKAEKDDKAKPNKKLALLKEHLKKMQEEEQKAKEEEERQRLLEEERIRLYEEQKRLEEERKQKKKQKEKERIERLKREGKFLTEKQKQDKRRLEQMLEAMKKDVGEPTAVGTEPANKHEAAPRKKPIYTKKKKQTGVGDAPEKSPSPTATSPTEAEVPTPELKPSAGGDEGPAEMVVEVEVQDAVLVAKEAEDVKDAWDAESEGEEEDEEEDEKEKSSATQVTSKTEEPTKEEESSQEEVSSEEEEVDEEEDESESESDDDDLTPAEKGRDKVMKRTEKANKERNVENLRAPVVCVLGHVDTGKTKILDKLRRTNVQDGEAGGITQQIGATNVPKDAILEKTKMCKEFTKQELKLPGLLIIDTPGHESFSNLRVRGTSLCDIAILVVDIMHGLEPQTIESINLLKERKTPFLVALNKIDRLYQWKAQPAADVQNTVKKQSQHTKSEFDERARNVILQLAEQGMNAALFYENKNPKEYVSLVPTSAHSGDGMGNLVALICELCQSMLAKRLMFSPNLQAVVMEVKAITGMGTTIDVILINGTLKEGDTIVLAGTEGPIVTQIRGLLMPQPMKELRVKNQYEHFKVVQAAQGVKVIAKDMEKALAGLPLYVAHDNDEKEYYKEEVAAVLKETLESIKVQDRGVFVQASTLGSLEALLEFLKTSEIPYAGISIGPVHKKDIMKASVMLEHDSQYAVILAFDVKVEREAQEMAENLGVRIFTADIIYHLFDAFIKFRDDLKKKKQEEFRHIAVFPCKLRILPQFIFNSRDPIVMGVSVEAGFVKEGTPICVPSKEFVDIGRVASIEMNHKPVDIARQGQEICIKIVPLPGEAPKMYGRHFEETDFLVSKISRQSIDAVKDHFREEMTKQDWKLMVELKKQFEIL